MKTRNDSPKQELAVHDFVAHIRPGPWAACFIGLVAGMAMCLVILAGMAMPARADVLANYAGQLADTGDLYAPATAPTSTVNFQAGWFSGDSSDTTSAAWGDMNGDGYLDLAVGNQQENRPGHTMVYLNARGTLSATAAWTSTEQDPNSSVAWGDVDGDGHLDLAVGNNCTAEPDCRSVRLYYNEGRLLAPDAAWSSAEVYSTTSIAWGDVNGDGYLDLAVATESGPVLLYQNDDGTLSSSAVWSSTLEYQATSIAWADVDDDGRLDLSVGVNCSLSGSECSSVVLFHNDGGTLGADPSWTSEEADAAHAVAWGDVNGDGRPDLAVGNWNEPTKLYLNSGVTLTNSAAWSSTETYNTTSLAWGDVNNDGYLDLVVGNSGQPKVVYLNSSGSLQTTASVIGADTDDTDGVALGDVDGDGDLDLAVANDVAEPNRLYFNQGLALNDAHAWTSTEANPTRSVAWGDVDSDGHLDLAVGNYSGHILLYRNTGITLTNSAVWSSTEVNNTTSVAWGDADGDGHLDLAAGNFVGHILLYRNTGTTLSGSATWSSTDVFQARSVAWGDMDGDGYLDLAVGNDCSLAGPDCRSAVIFRNDGGTLTTTPVWTSDAADPAYSVAWGDMNGDGKLDLAVGNYLGHNKVYLNVGGILQAAPAWAADTEDWTTSVAWADVNGDGKLDLAAGNEGQQNKIYLNQNGLLQTSAAWLSLDSEWTSGVAWGDVNGDGYPDLAVGSKQNTPVKIYLNNRGTLQNTASWTSVYTNSTYSVAWGDMDGDGNVDLAVGNDQAHNHVYLNQKPADLRHPEQKPPTVSIALESGQSPLAPADGYASPQVWTGTIPISYTLFNPGGERFAGVQAFYSPDGGGRWLSAKSPMSVQEYAAVQDLPLPIPDEDTVTATLPITGSGVIADLKVTLYITHTYDADLQVYLQSPAGTQVKLFEAVGESGEDFYYTEFDDQAAVPIENGSAPFDNVFQPQGRLSDFYGETVTGTWQLIVTDMDEEDTGTLLDWSLTIGTRPTLQTFLSSGEYVYEWDVLESGFFGQSDDVVFRLEALPDLHPITNSVPGPYQWPFVSTQTYPFRVRGNQIQVLSGSVPISNAIVYHIPANQSYGNAYADSAGNLFRTDDAGFLQGRGSLGLGDRLVALVPISATNTYTLYYTSGTPVPTGLTSHTIRDWGIQTLRVSSSNPLVLFNLDLTLEWDARNDGDFLTSLETAVQRASEVLYRVSNGQLALGDVRLHEAKSNWLSSDVILYAQNGIRPRASMGGVTHDLVNDVGLTGVITNAYGPGQVRMGANWDPFGQRLVELDQDWQRAFAHELSHYLLFLPDNYLGVKNGIPTNIDCKYSFMTSTYDDAYSQYLNRSGWVGDCLDSIATHTTGRTDWDTIEHFYGMLISPITSYTGPIVLPLNVTKLIQQNPGSPALTLTPRFFDLRGESGDLLAVPKAQAYIFKNPGKGDANLIYLGTTVANGDRIKVRGAEPGDRLCIFGPYDDATQSAYMGCLDPLKATDASIRLSSVPGWQPDIVVTSITSRTMAITVTLPVTAEHLYVQVFPAYSSPTATVAVNSPMAEMTSLDSTNPVTFTQVITLDAPAFESFVRVWVPDANPPQEAVTQIFLSPPWGPNTGGLGAGGNTRAWGANNRQLGAPVASGDGQVTIFNLQDIFAKTGTVSLQAINSLPHLPIWLTPVGQGYRFVATEVFSRVIAFDYLQRDVPAGYEHTLRIYYSPDEGQTWQRLDTELDQQGNRATAQMPNNAVNGQGIYALLSTIEMPALQPGWNLFGYPVPGTRVITKALASIDGAYTSVYYNDPVTGQWRLYDDTVVKNHPAYTSLVNDLSSAEFGRSYWLYATSAITPYLGVPVESEMQAAGSAPSLPPATFYGPVLATADFSPTVGMTITASISETVCGQGTVVNWQGQLAYKLQVAVDTGDGCGVIGRSVRFAANGLALNSHLWDNSQAWFHALTPEARFQVYLPVVTRSAP